MNKEDRERIRDGELKKLFPFNVCNFDDVDIKEDKFVN